MNAGSAAVQGAIWSAAPFEPIAEGAAPTHDALVAALRPSAGVRWLDVATGTGAVALRAARAGAAVTGLDIAPHLLADARRRAAAEGLRVRFHLGAAEALPYGDGTFEVVSSAQGVMFAVDHVAAGRELARVCVPGGRLGLTTLVAEGPTLELDRILGGHRARGFGPLDWGRPEYVEALLGAAFRLRIERGDAPVRAASAEAVWELYSRCYGPLKALADALAPPARDALRDRVVRIYRRYESGAGVIAPRPFLLILGIRSTNACN